MKSLLAMIVSSLAVPAAVHAQNITFPHDGLDREYRVHLPDELPESPAMVLVLHGLGMSNNMMMNFYGWTELADERGFIVVFPNGTRDQSNIRFWDVDYAIHEGLEIDDDGFLRELALYMQNKENTDPDRIFVTGFSNGGDMCYQLACRESETFMSFAPVTGTMMDTLFTSCDPAVPHSIWTMNGLDDPVVLYEGDMDNSDGWGAYRPIPEIIEFWATCLGMTDMESTYLPDVDPDDGSIVREDIYSSPQHDRELWYYLVIGGGHEWPGQSGNRDIDATLAIWNFFDGLPGEPCTPGEFNGDHVVDVMDMLLVISQWDNPYTVVDLLTVIGHWDSICTFPGACCLPDGTCDYIESVDCQAVGGDWKGARSSCTTTSCAVTINDECTGAIPVTNGATEFSTADATTSADAVDESQCPDTWLGSMGSDIWFSYEATCSGTLTLSTCSSANFDTELALYEGNCLNKVQVACNGDGADCSGYTSLLEASVTSGGQYLVRLGGWDDASSGTGTLVINCQE
ncbi:MAG: PHB depolymerase family esterase [Phycisphaerales bacterium]|nr:PHB depolymerase family esterase [Phycisphaerales bacterium]